MADDQTGERKQRRAELLDELLTSESWLTIVKPVLVARLRELERRGMSAKTIEDLRQFAGAHRVIEEILTDPRGFLAERSG